MMKEITSKIIINNLRQEELSTKEKGILVKELLKLPGMTYGRLAIILNKPKTTLHHWVEGRNEEKSDNLLNNFINKILSKEFKKSDKEEIKKIIEILEEKLSKL